MTQSSIYYEAFINAKPTIAYVFQNTDQLLHAINLKTKGTGQLQDLLCFQANQNLKH